MQGAGKGMQRDNKRMSWGNGSTSSYDVVFFWQSTDAKLENPKHIYKSIPNEGRIKG